MDTNELMRSARLSRRKAPAKSKIRPTKPDATPVRSLADLSSRRGGAVSGDRRRSSQGVRLYDQGAIWWRSFTNGTAVLGLGDIGPLAPTGHGGKCMLFKHFSGINAFDIEIDTIDPGSSPASSESPPTFGRINLEERKSSNVSESNALVELDIPVMHDDQRRTAIARQRSSTRCT